MTSSCPRQTGVECGVFMLAFMSILSSGASLPSTEEWTTNFNAQSFRQKMCLELLENRLLDSYDVTKEPLQSELYTNASECFRMNNIDLTGVEPMDVDN